MYPMGFQRQQSTAHLVIAREIAKVARSFVICERQVAVCVSDKRFDDPGVGDFVALLLIIFANLGISRRQFKIEIF
jgi:hypothetical protein